MATFDKLLGKVLLHAHKADDVLSAALVGTKANILATTPSESGKLAYATDTQEFYLYDGSNWQKTDYKYYDAIEDLGAYEANHDGYYRHVITNKKIANSLIGANDRDEEGAVRLVGGNFQIYANGVWNDVVINFVLREHESGGFEFEHIPVGFTKWIEIMSGNTNDYQDARQYPLVQQYNINLGAYSTNPIVDGGVF